MIRNIYLFVGMIVALFFIAKRKLTHEDDLANNVQIVFGACLFWPVIVTLYGVERYRNWKDSSDVREVSGSEGSDTGVDGQAGA